ncbi:MAG: hypothetical protein RJA99_3926 [Pseudomonadota bacterium]|jgi:RimJ/RimL family protein N-acetyltransferase
MNIDTPRLKLRPFRHDDAEDVVRLSSLDRLFMFMPYNVRYRDVDAARLAIEEWREAEARDPGFGVWRIATHDDRLVGSTFLGLCPRQVGHFGGVCLPEFWGRGIAFEACAALIEHGFRLGLIGTISFSHQHNASAHSVLKVCGFVERSVVQYGDLPVSCFSVSRRAWAARADLLIGQGLAVRPRTLLRQLRRLDAARPDASGQT